LGIGVQGSGFGVQGSGFRVQGSGFRVQGSGFTVQGAGFRVLLFVPLPHPPLEGSRFEFRVEGYHDAQGTPTLSHISPSTLVYEVYHQAY
jgi:hypothetical protein